MDGLVPEGIATEIIASVFGAGFGLLVTTVVEAIRYVGSRSKKKQIDAEIQLHLERKYQKLFRLLSKHFEKRVEQQQDQLQASKKLHEAQFEILNLRIEKVEQLLNQNPSQE